MFGGFGAARLSAAYRQGMSKDCPRKTVSLGEMRAILGYDGKGIDHAKIMQAMNADTIVDGVRYSIAESAATQDQTDTEGEARP